MSPDAVSTVNLLHPIVPQQTVGQLQHYSLTLSEVLEKLKMGISMPAYHCRAPPPLMQPTQDYVLVQRPEPLPVSPAKTNCEIPIEGTCNFATGQVSAHGHGFTGRPWEARLCSQAFASIRGASPALALISPALPNCCNANSISSGNSGAGHPTQASALRSLIAIINRAIDSRKLPNQMLAAAVVAVLG